MSEIEIQNAICDYLNSIKAQNWRISSDIMSNFPDILVNYRGRFLALEVKKSAKAEFRKGQKKTIRDIISDGGYGAAVWSVDMVKDLLKEIDKEVEDAKRNNT